MRTCEQQVVSVIDCMVAEAQPEALEACADEIRQLILQRRQGYLVTTATGKLNQLLEAQQATRLILLLSSRSRLVRSDARSGSRAIAARA